MEELKLGIYKHFKGKLYEVIALARHSETREEMVVYKALYVHEEFGKDTVWVRPLKMFIEHVERDGYSGPRFAYVAKK
jgi:hypothetical protein